MMFMKFQVKFVILSTCIPDTAESNWLRYKVLAFCGDNTNWYFSGASWRGCNTIFYKLQKDLGSNLVGANCAVHIAHKCISTVTESLPFDVEIIVDNIFRHFHIYTVRNEELVKSYFLSQEKCPSYHQNFFWEWTNRRLVALSITAIFQSATSKIESQKISVTEVARVISDLRTETS